jgi:ABC-type nitrate/sulfonate/bicarbonate transport system permease component
MKQHESEVSVEDLGLPATEAEETPIEDHAAPPRARGKIWMIRLASMVTVISAWEFVGRRSSPLFLPSPTAVVKAGVTMIATGELLGALASSLQTVVIGFFTASAVGIVLGLLTGLRLGIGRAIIGMVVAEFFAAITGLGALIVKYGNRYDTASMFVPILVLMLLGILLTSLVRRAEEHFAPWRMADD